MTIIYDGDAAGIKASLRGIDLVLEEGLNVRVLLLPDGEDPDSFARSHTPQDLADFIANNETDFINFKTKLLLGTAGDDPVERARLITDIVRSIAKIPDNIVRSVYVRETAHQLDVEERVFIYRDCQGSLEERGTTFQNSCCDSGIEGNNPDTRSDSL